ncbi:hypothetical protein L9F63_023411, partial [Diploptera punctata]
MLEHYSLLKLLPITSELIHLEKIPGQGVGRVVKHSDSCLEDDENTIREFILSVLSEDKSLYYPPRASSPKYSQESLAIRKWLLLTKEGFRAAEKVTMDLTKWLAYKFVIQN